MIRKNLMKSLSVIMAAMMAIMTVACGSNTVDTTAETAVEMAAEEEAGEDPLANTVVSASNIASAESEAGKVETVYVTADANGAVNDVIVSEWLKNAAASPEIADTTQLKDIVNVKGDETFTDNGDGTLTWNAAGSDIYYQGTTNKQLPVNMKITYTLDGKEITPEELAGKSGKVTIRFEYENNDKQTVEVNGKDVDVYTPFAMVSGMMLDSDKFTNVEISNGKVISDGGNIIVMGVALPGLKESLDISDDKWDELEDADEIKDRLSNSFEITADTTDFELGMTITMASSDILSDFGMTDLSGSDKLDDLKSDMEDLNDGSNKLVDGTKELKDGTKEFADGTKKLYDGATELKDGTQKLYDGTGSLTDGTSKLASGASALSEGIDQYTDGVSKVNDGAGKLAGGVTQLKDGTAALKAGMESPKFTKGSQALADGAKELVEGTSTFSKGLNTKLDEAKAQEACYTTIRKWLENKDDSLSVPEDEGAKKMFLTCLATASGGKLTSIQQAEGFMAGVKQSSAVIDSLCKDGNQTNTSHTVVTTMSADDLFSGLIDDESGEVPASVTTETPIPSDNDNTEEIVIDTDENPDGIDKDKEEVIEQVEDDADTASLEKKDESVEKPDENKGGNQGNAENTDPADKPSAPNTDQTIPTTEADRQKTVTLDLGDEDGDDAATLNSTGNMIMSKKVVINNSVDMTYTPEQISGAVNCIVSYNKMLGSAEALEGAAGKTVDMIKNMLIPSVNKLNAGATELGTGLGQYQSGVLDIYKGALALNSGMGELSTGISQLKEGTSKLAENSDKLRDGASQLADGANQLNDGAVELRDGAGKLNDGTGELKDGTKELYDGSIELDNGVKELLDGVTKFDKEGIKKIYEAFDGDLSDFTDRLDAIKEAGSSYKTFGGSADDVDSSVKFIIKTDSIKSL